LYSGMDAWCARFTLYCWQKDRRGVAAPDLCCHPELVSGSRKISIVTEENTHCRSAGRSGIICDFFGILRLR
jgi:hypothetical protein